MKEAIAAQEELRIDFQKSIKPILKNVFLFNGCLLFCTIPLLFFIISQTWEYAPIFTFFAIGGVIITFIVAKKYHANALYREYIIVNTQKLTVVNQTGSNTKKKVFEIDAIKKLAFVGTIDYTDHPLKNDIIDITGVVTTEKELQFLIDEGTMEITTANESFRFGKNIPSWEAERIIHLVKDFLGDRITTELAY